MWSSGYVSVTTRPVRERSTVSPVESSARHRIPSSFGSNHQPSSSKAWWPPSASIGRNDGGEAISGAVCALARNASQSVRVLTKWNSRFGYRRPWSRNETFVSVHSTGSYHPSSKMRTSPAP